ncbi:MAG: TonB-dependent receptor [Rubrivivax sp.]
MFDTSARGVRLEVSLLFVAPTIHRAQIAAAVLVLLSSSGAALAQTIVITGSREPAALDRLAADVVVIDAATIRASTADSLADLLRREAGLQLSRNGGPGHSSSLFMRGANAGQTVLVVDGVRVGSATLGQPSLDVLPLSQIERIEILRGPGSSLYGADAVGGVIQVFTREAQAGTQFDAAAAVGGDGGRQLSGGVRSRQGAWDLAAGLAHERSDGVSTLRPGDQFGNYNPDKDGYTLSSAQARVGFRPAEGHRIGLTLLKSKLDVQYDGSEFLPPSYAQDNSADFRDKQTSELAALDWRGSLGPGLVASVGVTHGVDDLASGGNAVSRYRTVRRGLKAQLAWNSGLAGQLIAAIERGDDKATATPYSGEQSRKSDAAVLALVGDVGAWSWQGELRRDDSSDFGGVTTARLGGGYKLLPSLKLRVLAGTTFRAPSFNDLYYPGYGVATLQPERGRSAEIGLNWRSEGTEAAATVFRNRVRDLIGYEADRSFCPPDPAYDFGCARNINRAQLDGSTLSGLQRLGGWVLKAQLDFLTARDETTGARLSRRAAHQASLGADWSGGPFSAGASALRVGARPDGSKTLEAETTLDLKAGWRFAPGWQLQAKLLNATDRDTEPARDYQGLGRQAWLGLRFDGGL